MQTLASQLSLNLPPAILFNNVGYKRSFTKRHFVRTLRLVVPQGTTHWLYKHKR